MPTQVDGITQPAPVRHHRLQCALNDSGLHSAGVGDRQWSASQSLEKYQSALGDSNAKYDPYA